MSATLSFVLGTLFLGASAANALTVNANFQQIRFENASAVDSSNATSGAPFRYQNVITIGSQQIDVLLSVISVENGTTITDVDQASNNLASGAQHEWINSDVDFDSSNSISGNGGSTTYKLDFVEHLTSTPITVQNVAISVSDIDNDQFAEFSGITGYVLTTNPATRLTAQTSADQITPSVPAGSYRFQSTSANTNASDQKNWVEVRYAETSSLQIVLGAVVDGGAFFSIDFQPSLWTSVTSTSGTTNAPPSYTLSYDSNNSGTGSTPSNSSGFGSISTAPNSGSLSKPGYTFAGWNTAADGSGTTYQPGDSLNLTSNITLYAMWTPALAQTGFGTSSALLTPLGISLLAMGFILVIASRRFSFSRRSNFLS